ncbi:MAG TPA: MCE family protein [Bacteroidetes bacterium]|nr:MCE family protein [Bacteroidota bacterium]
MKIAREVKIGVFVVLVVASFIWGYSFLKGKNVFKPGTIYYVVYDKVNGLTESSPVLLNGFKVGQVSYLDLIPDGSGRLLAKIWMEKDFPIPKNTVAQIYSADLMGSKAIRLNLAASGEFHQPGDTLASDIEGSLQEQVSIEMLPLKQKAENLLLSIDSVMAVIQTTFNQDFRENFSVSFDKIRSTIASLNRSMYTLDTLITNKDGSIIRILNDTRSLTAEMEANKKDITQIVQNFRSISDSLAAADITSAIENLSLTLNETQALLSRINSGEGTLGQLMVNDSLYRNLEGASRELEQLLADLKAHPKRYVRFSLIDFGKDQGEKEK